MKVKTTERGWAGHFICSSDCRFRRNTLVHRLRDDVYIVVSTVGMMFLPDDTKGVPKEIGWKQHYETRLFYSNEHDKKFHDIDVHQEISRVLHWGIANPFKDNEANDMHDRHVAAIKATLKAGDLP